MTSSQWNIRDFLAKHPASKAYVGFSGGVDSTALLLMLLEANVAVTAVHFHHGIRGEEADADAEWCRRFCAERQLSFQLIRLDVPNHKQNGESIEEAARRLRLEAWKQLVDESPAPIFLAHHADDALEELFLRLARGSNCTGLTSIREVRRFDGLTFCRPLTSIRKSELQQFLETRGIHDWRTDSTNADCHYRRNAVRNRLLPLAKEIFGTDGGLIRSLQSLKADADYLEAQALQALQGINDIEDWQNLHVALLPRVFRLWRFNQDHIDEAPTHSFINSLASALRNFDGTPVVLQLDSSTIVRVAKRGLRLEKLTPCDAPVFHFSWNWKTQPELPIPELGMTLTAYSKSIDSSLYTRKTVDTSSDDEFAEQFAYDSMPDTLTIRPWQPGDKMIPFGHSSPKKLQDLFTDAHVPRAMRQRIPVITADDAIIWVPSVRRAEFGRCDSDSTNNVVIFCNIKTAQMPPLLDNEP